ncbi:hypothetical protein [Paenibacillus sp. GCM10027626]|uniref:hypothetical protein n=1 Tax=Paenibacillus sp. GCM10027626 TaxID=3273411 RepID=UPI003643AFE2
MRARPYAVSCSHARPLLQYVRQHAHDHVELTAELLTDVSGRALWFDYPDDRLLIASFRFCNFIQARMAPQATAVKLAAFVLGWLLGATVQTDGLSFVYATRACDEQEALLPQVEACARRALGWFERSGVVSAEGRNGALEGPASEVYADGTQRMSTIHRVDCIGEIALPYMLHHLLTSDSRSLRIAGNLQDHLYEQYVCRDDECWHGMMRWTEEAWGVCYQDDVARAVIPQLLKCLYMDSDEHLADIATALRFLVRTTGTDGTRVFRTVNSRLDAAAIERLASAPGNLPSAHYNAYYHAALLLAYKLTGEQSFRDTAVRGLTTMMAAYPDTRREQSQTQEYCRLIMPLAWLYWVTGERVHKEWLYRVTADLQTFRHPSGAYIEWDEGYRAAMRHAVGQGESSLLARNGDPVVDLLYSNNWLPSAYIQAYYVTGDPMFKSLWESSARFFISAQLHSADPALDGAWARAFDADRREVFGSPADSGWGPWSIESGWTVAEVASGLLMGLLEERLRPHYNHEWE